jgi:hypothetical protein
MKLLTVNIVTTNLNQRMRYKCLIFREQETEGITKMGNAFNELVVSVNNFLNTRKKVDTYDVFYYKMIQGEWRFLVFHRW